MSAETAAASGYTAWLEWLTHDVDLTALFRDEFEAELAGELLIPATVAHLAVRLVALDVSEAAGNCAHDFWPGMYHR
jgi:hypothetical protein